MNRTLGVLAVATLTLAAAGCGRDDDDGGGGDAAGTQPPAPEEEASGSITIWAMGTEGENLDVIAEDFMAEYPDVRAEVTAIPWDAAHDRIVNAIAAGEVPDVSLIGTTWMGEFAALGGLDPTPASIEPSAFYEGAWDTTVVNGVSYGVPWYVETRVVYYRTDLAEQGGFDEAPADWDQLRQLAEATQEGGAQWGISLQPGQTGAWQTYMPFFWQAGGEMVDDEGNFSIDGEACVESLTYFDSFFEDGLSQPAVSDVPVEGQFANGDVGAFISGPWMIGVVTDAGADPATFTVVPQPTEDAGTSFVGGGNLAVFDQSDNKAAAWAFVEYTTRPEVQAKWYETVSALPAVQAAWDEEALSGDEMLSVFGEQLEDAKSPPAIPRWEQVAQVIDDQLEQVVQGNTTPEDGCAAMQSGAEAIGTGT